MVAKTLKRLMWLLLAIVVAYQLWVFAHVLLWTWVNPATTSFMDIRRDELHKKNPKAELKHKWVAYNQISLHLKRAVVASEDDIFMEHNGFDMKNIKRALKRNNTRGKSIVGGSTITQQLAKNLFLSPSRSYWRKAEEAIITVMIELLWDKRRILEVYLNVVEWGNGVFGAEAAAQHYYRIPAARLAPQQAAHIAVMLPNPRKYEKRYPAWVAAHSRSVQARMHYSKVP